MFETVSIESVVIDFNDSTEFFESVFGPGGELFCPGGSRKICENLTNIVNRLNCLGTKEEITLYRQCTIAKTIITLSLAYGGTPYIVFHSSDTLELQFSFDETSFAQLFRNNLKVFVERSTGFIL